MPKLNKEIIKHLLFVVAVLFAFMLSMLGLDVINTKVNADMSEYKKTMLRP